MGGPYTTKMSLYTFILGNVDGVLSWKYFRQREGAILTTERSGYQVVEGSKHTTEHVKPLLCLLYKLIPSVSFWQEHLHGVRHHSAKQTFMLTWS